VVPFLVQFGLYVSPVGFSSAIVPGKWQLLYALNPMVGVIEGFRTITKVTSVSTAEAGAWVENTQRDLNIRLVNELVAAGTQWNLLPLRPGLVGGNCNVARLNDAE